MQDGPEELRATVPFGLYGCCFNNIEDFAISDNAGNTSTDVNLDISAIESALDFIIDSFSFL